VAALIIFGSEIYAVNVFNQKKEAAPLKKMEQGIEQLKEEAGQAMQSRLLC
jgi:hypothetical protein